MNPTLGFISRVLTCITWKKKIGRLLLHHKIYLFFTKLCFICPISVTFFFLCSLTLPTTKYSIIVFLNIWLNKYYITKRKFNSSCSCILGLIILYFNLLINIENITNWLVYFIYWSCFIYFYLINQIRLRPLQM